MGEGEAQGEGLKEAAPGRSREVGTSSNARPMRLFWGYGKGGTRGCGVGKTVAGCWCRERGEWVRERPSGRGLRGPPPV